MFINYFKNRRIRKFLTVIPRKLSKDYGHSHEYSTGQVSTAAKKLGYVDQGLIDIAIAIYCNKDVAKAFGMNTALIKKYKGYPEKYRVSGCSSDGGGFDGVGSDGGGSD